MSIREKFEQRFLTSIWDRVRFFLFLKKLRRVKTTAMWEANLDKLFFEQQYASMLGYSDAADRELLARENRKPLDQRDEKVITEAEGRIAQGKAIMVSYRKNEQFIAELQHYLNMLDLWENSQSGSQPAGTTDTPQT